MRNLWMKIVIILIILFLTGASYFLYRFLYDQENELLRGRIIPVPELDINTYDRLLRPNEP